MKLVSITAAAGALMLAATAAMAAPMDVYFDNTLVVHSDGGDALMHLNADQTYVLTAPDGAQIAGQWEQRDGKLCLTDVRGTDCWEQNEMEVGQSVTSTSESGETASLTLREGR